MNHYKCFFAVFVLVCMFGCQKNEAPQTIKTEQSQQQGIKVPLNSYLDTEVGMWNARCDGKSLRQFIDGVNNSVNNSGSWQKIDDEKWMYIITMTDPVTTKSTEFRMLFIPIMDTRNGSGPLVPYIMLDRLVVNKNDINGDQTTKLFNEVCEKIK